MGNKHKRRGKGGQNPPIQQHQYDEIARRNKELADGAKQSDSKFKAKTAECEGVTAEKDLLAKQLAEKEKEIADLKARPTTVVVQQAEEDSELVRIIDKMIDHDTNKALNQQELAETAIQFQQKMNDEKLRFLRAEQAILCESPEVKAAGLERDHRFNLQRALFRLGSATLVAAMGVCAAAVTYKLSLLFIAGGMSFSGIFLMILGYAPSISVEDTKKIAALSSVFSTNFKKLQGKGEKLALPPPETQGSGDPVDQENNGEM